MPATEYQIAALVAKKTEAIIRVQTLGSFQVWRAGTLVTTKAWGRDKTIQLFQFLVTARHRRALHKEQIISRLWEDMDNKSGKQNFKVAMHGVNKVLEPNRKSRTEPRFVVRQGLTYRLDQTAIWIDADAMEKLIIVGNRLLTKNPMLAQTAYQEALQLYQGNYLPNRLYEDWTSAERERLQVLALNTMITLGELTVHQNPLESIRLAQQALLIDNAWEDAYRLQMVAYFKKGNRPMAIKVFRQCKKVLHREFGISPLPETQKLFKKIQSIK